MPPDRDDTGWLQVKLGIQVEGIDRIESPEWLLDHSPGTAGIEKRLLAWDLSPVLAKLPANATWLKIELVNQGDRARTLYLDQFRCTTVSKEGKSVGH